MDIPFKNETLSGKVKMVDTTFSPIIGSVKVIAEIPNLNRILRPGLNAKMVIEPANANAAVGLRR